MKQQYVILCWTVTALFYDPLVSKAHLCWKSAIQNLLKEENFTSLNLSLFTAFYSKLWWPTQQEIHCKVPIYLDNPKHFYFLAKMAAVLVAPSPPSMAYLFWMWKCWMSWHYYSNHIFWFYRVHVKTKELESSWPHNKFWRYRLCCNGPLSICYNNYLS